MIKLPRQLKSEKGFTLIELLVVIAIIGVLMVGTLVALNPLAQINKAKDANAKGRMDQAITAVQGYYTTNQAYPQSTGTVSGSGKDLNSWPTDPVGTAMSFSVKPVGCTTACSTVAISFPLQFNDGTNTVWCWRANAGVPTSGDPVATTAALCVAP